MAVHDVGDAAPVEALKLLVLFAERRFEEW
jgi:hypothetical protein